MKIFSKGWKNLASAEGLGNRFFTACKYYFDKFAVGMKQTVVFKLARNQRVLNSWLGQRFFFLSLLYSSCGDNKTMIIIVFLCQLCWYGVYWETKKILVNEWYIFRYCISTVSSTVECQIDVRGRSQITLTRFWLFWPPTPLRWHFLSYENWQKGQHFWTTYSPPLVNVVCEQPLRLRLFFPTLSSHDMARLLLLSLFEQQTSSLIDQYLSPTVCFLLETQYTR